MLKIFGRTLLLFENSHASPACPSDRSRMKVKMSMEHWWNDTDRKKPKCWRQTCPSATESKSLT
jgi:hypothetical protein